MKGEVIASLFSIYVTSNTYQTPDFCPDPFPLIQSCSPPKSIGQD